MPRNAGLTTDVSRRIDDFVTIILLPLFFAVTGLRVDVTGLDDGLLWLFTLGILAIAVLGKWGGGLIASRYVGFSLRDSAVIGALLNTRGLTELIVLNIALTAGAISPKLFSMFVLMALATTFMAGPALRLLDPRHELSSPVEEEVELEAGEGIGLRTIVVAGRMTVISVPCLRSPSLLLVRSRLASSSLSRRCGRRPSSPDVFATWTRWRVRVAGSTISGVSSPGTGSRPAWRLSCRATRLGITSGWRRTIPLT
jgi:hypothetical protein